MGPFWPSGRTMLGPWTPNDPRVRLERDGNVAVVTLDDPARRNALSLEVTVQLGQAVDEAAADP